MTGRFGNNYRLRNVTEYGNGTIQLFFAADAV